MTAAGTLGARQRFLRRLRGNASLVPAVVVLVVLVATGLFAPLVAPADPLDQDLLHRMTGPSAEHWLGTDQTGRDILSRLVFGARVALIAVGEGVGVAVGIGVPLGLFLGYRGGWWDRIGMRIVEAVVSIPGIMVAIVIVTILGTGLTNAMIALGLLFSTQFIRLCRGLVIAEREEEYVRAARVLGAGPTRITVRHLVPNIAGPIVVQITLTCGAVLLSEAGLSFLGLAVQPPDASWGTMLTDAAQFLALDPWQAIPPGAAIFVSVLAVNLVGDAIRDAIGRGAAHTVVAGADAEPTGIGVALHIGRPAAVGRGAEAASGGAPDSVPPDSVSAGSVSADSGPEVLDPDEVLRVRGLEIRFPSPRGELVPVVTGVSFSVRRGETLGLVGESGSGKTVTALSALGMVPPPGVVTAGSVRLADGTDMVTASSRELRAARGSVVSMVFQDPMASLNPSIRVGQQLTESLQVKAGLDRSAARARAVELLDLVGITDPAERAGRYPHELSGGMVQRVAIARALSCDPVLLIADEPTTALDVTVQAGILDLLTGLQDELGMAMVFISHDLGVIAEICDRAAVMYAGEIVEEGTVDDLLLRPRHPYTEALLGSMPTGTGKGTRLPTIPGVVPRAGDWGAGCRFASRCRHARDDCGRPQILTVAGAGGDGRPHTVRCWLADRLELEGVGDERPGDRAEDRPGDRDEEVVDAAPGR